MEEKDKKIHEKYAKGLFNRTWDLMDKKDRTPDEEVEMIHTSHASSYHWSQIGEPLNFQRGEWQVSRVYAILKHREACLFHAQRCLNLTKEHDIKDFDLAFAYEAMARAYSIAGKTEEKHKYLKLAKEVAEKIAKKGDKDYFLGELATIQ